MGILLKSHHDKFITPICDITRWAGQAIFSRITPELDVD